MKNGKYLKPDGTTVEVLDFDEANKMVYTKKGEFSREWRHDYNDWIPVDDSYPSSIPDTPMEMEEDEPQISLTEPTEKLKRTRIKKEK